MTVRDRQQLQRMVETIARSQRKRALPDKRNVAAPVLAAAQEAVPAYGLGAAEEVVAARTGAKKPTVQKAVDTVVKAGGALTVNFLEPRYRFKERVAQLISDGLTKEAAEDCVRNLILTRESEPLATVGKVVPIEQLAPGQRFRYNGGTVFTGCLLYKTPSRARVLVDAGAPSERSFTTRKGEQVVINSAGRTERNLAPDCTVTVLAGREDISALLHAENKVESDRVKNSKADPVKPAAAEDEDNMAKAKKAAKKSNGAAVKTGKRAEFNAKQIKVLAEKNPKREGSASAKRFALYKNGMTVGAFIEKGGTLGDVHYDVAHKHISVS